jgi:hypothetical protein
MSFSNTDVYSMEYINPMVNITYLYVNDVRTEDIAIPESIQK